MTSLMRLWAFIDNPCLALPPKKECKLSLPKIKTTVWRVKTLNNKVI